VGLGIFKFLYSLRQFYWVTKIVYYLIAGMCFTLAGLALYDLRIFKKTGKTEELTLQLPQTIKNRIHAIIGSHYRRTPEEKVVLMHRSILCDLSQARLLQGFSVIA